MIIPIENRVVILPDQAETVTKGGIYIPERAQERPSRGTIFAIGDDVVKVKVGDKVMYGKRVGTNITYEEVEYVILREPELFAIL